jgi:hypothetical protein
MMTRITISFLTLRTSRSAALADDSFTNPSQRHLTRNSMYLPPNARIGRDHIPRFVSIGVYVFRCQPSGHNDMYTG